MELINDIKTHIKQKNLNETVFVFIEDNIEELVDKLNNVKILEELINYAKYMYHNEEAVLSDYAYDKLIEKMEIIDPNNKTLTDIGYKIASVNKIKLPYHMGSMSKVKPDTSQILTKYKLEFTGPYIVSNKLDGVSGMLIVERNQKMYLYTRGDGEIGSNVSHIIPYLNILNKNNIFAYLQENNLSRIIFRCEIIIPIKTFYDKYQDISANPRNFVSGQVNAKQISGNILNDIHLVFYEIIEPWTTIDQQYGILTTLGLRTSPFELWTNNKLSIEQLQNELKSRKESSLYEIDGLIISDIDDHDRNTVGNPEYSIAFKETTVVTKAIIDYVEWNISKDNYFKPRVKIIPIKLGGVTIKYATANNAKYVYANKLGPGAEIIITRSGDVIPKILKVTKPASHPQMPTLGIGNWIWNDTGVDILLDSDEINNEQLIKILAFFAKHLNIKNIDEATFRTMVENDLIKQLSDIFYLTKSDLLKLEGFQEKKASKIMDEINNAFNRMHLVDLMIASNILGRGLGPKKIKKIISKYPDITIQSYKPYDVLVDMIDDIPGFDEIMAKKFVGNLDKFNEFMEELPSIIKNRLILDTIPVKKSKNKIDLTGTKFVFTGFRNKEWEKIITDYGGEMSSSVSKNTSLVVCEDLNDKSNKLTKAKQLGIKIVTQNEFIEYMNKTYGIKNFINLDKIIEM
jgi:DNA ligase (NAD+)